MDINGLVIKYEAFIFDFDGVIVDSLAIKAEAFGLLFADLGTEVMKRVKEHHLNNGGVSRYEKFQYYFQEYRGREITTQESAALDQQYSDLVVRKVIEAKTIPGVMEFLTLIKASGKFCCVVSATPQKEIRHIVEERKMSGFFAEVLGSPRSKNENVGILFERNKLVAQMTIYFGDAKSDYEAAKSYGLNFIGIAAAQGGELNAVKGIQLIQNFLY